MNYIYDILINFNETLYEFYDWNISDDIKHIRKIPIFKVNSSALYEIKNNKVIFNDEWLDNIKSKTEVFKNRKTQNINYAFLISDGLEVLAIKWDKKIFYSHLLIDEENEVIDICNNLEESLIPYKVLEPIVLNDFKTRKQICMEEGIKKELKKMINENNIDKLKYIYYECFNEKTNSMNKIIRKFSSDLSNEIIFKLNKILNLKISKL